MWRLILDLASPDIQSLIDGNDEDQDSITYNIISISDMTAVVVKTGT